MGIVSSLILSRYSNTLAHTNLVRTVQEVKSVFDYAREYSLSTHQDVGVSLNIKAGRLLSVDVIKMTDQVPVSLETLQLSPPLLVESSPEVSHVVFRFNAPLELKLGSSVILNSSNYVLRFVTHTNSTSDVVVFYHSSAVQVFRKGDR